MNKTEVQAVAEDVDESTLLETGGVAEMCQDPYSGITIGEHIPTIGHPQQPLGGSMPGRASLKEGTDKC